MNRVHQARRRRAQALMGKRGAAAGAQAGLQVPGLFKVRLDAALLKRAELLSENWRILLRETYDLGKEGSTDEKLRPGFDAELGREVRAGMMSYLKWWQLQAQTEPGGLLPDFTKQFTGELATYNAVRLKVNHVLELRGTRTASLGPDQVYDPKTEPPPLVEGFQRRLLEGVVLAGLIALAFKIFGGRGQRRQPDVIYYEV